MSITMNLLYAPINWIKHSAKVLEHNNKNKTKTNKQITVTTITAEITTN